jgi:hypothetical protein
VDAFRQHVEDFTLMIDGAPELHSLARDPNHHFVRMPPGARARAALPKPRFERWQYCVTPPWKRIGGGCHLDRRIDDLIRSSGFQTGTSVWAA